MVSSGGFHNNPTFRREPSPIDAPLSPGDDSRIYHDNSNNSSFVVMNHSQNQWPPKRRNDNFINKAASPDLVILGTGGGNEDSFLIPRSHSPK